MRISKKLTAGVAVAAVSVATLFTGPAAFAQSPEYQTQFHDKGGWDDKHDGGFCGCDRGVIERTWYDSYGYDSGKDGWGKDSWGKDDWGKDW